MFGCRVSISSLAFLLVVVATGPAWSAERISGSGTRVENDRFGTSRLWGHDLVLDKPGTISRVMHGTYGFQILDESGAVVGDFLLPEMAVGHHLEAGRYQLKPSVCRTHRHHHVEVTVEY